MADIVGLYHSIPHEKGLKPLCKKLEERVETKIQLSNLVKMIEFALKNNCFEFDSRVKKRISNTAIET